MRVDERMEHRIRTVMRKKAAAVGTGQLACAAGAGEGDEEIAGLLRMQKGTELRRGQRAGKGE